MAAAKASRPRSSTATAEATRDEAEEEGVNDEKGEARENSSTAVHVIVLDGACCIIISFEKHRGLCFRDVGPRDDSEKDGEKSLPLVLFEGLCDLDLPLRDSCVNETSV